MAKTFEEVEQEPYDKKSKILHEDGHEIPAHQSWFVKNLFRVQDLQGRSYDHVGEKDGRWTYREVR